MERQTKPKILFIARRFPPSVGGMERFAFDLLSALKKENDVTAITWGGSNKWLPLVLPVFFFRASWVLLTNKIDVIHIQDGVQAPMGWLLSVIFHRPFIIVAHGLDITYQKAFYPSLILPFVRKAQHVVSISTATQDQVLERGVHSKNASVITLGTHDEYTDLSQDKVKLGQLIGIDGLADRKILLTTGRLVRRKGVEWFIRNVLGKLVADDSNLVYLVAGEGEQRQNITEAIEQSGLAEHVVLLGRVSDEARLALYVTADVFVMPNIVVAGDMEGFGIVVHEAANAGTPVVASSLEGIKDALRHKKNGILVETQDAAAFYIEIKNLLSDPAYAHEFGLSARQYTLSEYSWTVIAKKYTDLYVSLLGKR